jgi:integrase
MLKKAVEWEMADHSPFDKGKSLMLKENNKRLRFLNKDEIYMLLDECPDHLKDIIECALNTGMRKGEILNLKWDQIRNGFIYLSKTKTNEARQIPINDDLETLFKRIRKKQHLRSDHVFTFYRVTKKPKPFNGKPITDTVKTAFNAAVKRAGLVDFRFHDLRHTFASQMIMHGGSLKDVQELLGHKTMSMTLRYSHLSQEHKRKAVNLLNGLTGQDNQNPMSENVRFLDSRQNAKKEPDLNN